ncbi:MAG: restriction endonuclease subunit S [Burkholderiaceae bacterium]
MNRHSMQSRLEQLEKDYGIEWREYSLEALFGRSTRGRRLKSADRIAGNLPFVTAGETDTGISDWIGNKVRIFSKNTITIDMFGSAKYRGYEYGADDHVAVVHTEKLSPQAALFVTTAIHKSSHAGQFDYSRNFYATDADKLTIQLPTISQNGVSLIAFDFIETFIATLNAERLATLNAERLATLNAYLKLTNLQDYTLTDDEQTALDALDTVTWGEFKIEDVLVWQKSIIELNPLHLSSLTISDEKKYPFYGQATTNNGIIEYRHLKESVLNNPLGKPTILVHSNNQNTVYLETPFYLKDGHGATSVLQSENLDKMIAQFLIGSIKKVIFQKYTYNSKATKIELKNTKITLPVKSDNTPNYGYMKLIICAMQKVVIKNVVDYLDVRITKTNEVAY